MDDDVDTASFLIIFEMNLRHASHETTPNLQLFWSRLNADEIVPQMRQAENWDPELIVDEPKMNKTKQKNDLRKNFIGLTIYLKLKVIIFRICEINFTNKTEKGS